MNCATPAPDPTHRIAPPRWEYWGYALLVRIKCLLRLPLARHRKFMVWKLIRLIEQGRISRDRLSLTSLGKSDGVGAQAMAKFSAMCLAEAYQLDYIHTPFSTLAHSESPMETWVSAWETLLGLSEYRENPPNQPTRTCGIETYVFNPKYWNDRVCLSAKHFHAFCQLAPHYGEIVAKKIRTAYWRDEQARAPGDPIDLCVHVRRGDVRPDDPETAYRFTSHSEIVSLLEWMLPIMRRQGRQVRLHVYSNGRPSDFEDFPEFPELAYHLEASALDTFKALAKADVLITTRSDFSHLAAIYCRGIVLCDPRHRTPLPSWTGMDTLKCAIAKEHLEARIETTFSR